MTGRKTRSGLGAVALFTALVGAAACSDEFEDCASSRTCTDGGGASAGGAGVPNMAGAGANSGDAGEGGVAGGTNVELGGAAGTGRAGGDAGSPIGAAAGAGGEGGDGGVPDECSASPDCDDQDACNGAETCVDGSCVVGEAVTCPPHLECESVAAEAQCVFEAGVGPWVVYAANEETSGKVELFGARRNLLGETKRYKLSGALRAGEEVPSFNAAHWSPDGESLVFLTYEAFADVRRAYLLELGAGEPPAPRELEGVADLAPTSVRWMPGGDALLFQGGRLWHYPLATPAAAAALSSDEQSLHAFWVASDNRVFVHTYVTTPFQSNVHDYRRVSGTWQAPQLLNGTSAVMSAQLSPNGAYFAIETATALGSAQFTDYSLSYLDARTSAPLSPLALPSAAGPLFAFSPDSSRLVLASALTTTTSEAFMVAPPSSKVLIKTGITLSSKFLGGVWSPDSKAVLFFDSAQTWDGQALVIHELGAVEPWRVLGHDVAHDGINAWTPDSKHVVCVTRTSAAAAGTLSAVARSNGTATPLDTLPATSTLSNLAVTDGGQLLIYAKISNAAVITAHYVDASQGITQAKPAAALPGAGAIAWFDAAADGESVLYGRSGATSVGRLFDLRRFPDSVRLNLAGSIRPSSAAVQP